MRTRPNRILVKAFLGLTDTQLCRLVWHAKQKTPICCGSDANLYVDGKGGG